MAAPEFYYDKSIFTDSRLDLTNTGSSLANMDSELHTQADGFSFDFKGFSGIAAGGYSVYWNKGLKV